MPAVGRPGPATPLPRLLERLFAEKKITREQYEGVASKWRREGGPIEEILLATQVFPTEADLLKFLAALYRVRFVSTEKLAKAAVDRSTLDLVPRKVCERNTLFPVILDRKTASLSVVMAAPDDVQALEEVKMASRVREVIPLVARPAAVLAAIAKFYAGDLRPFAALERDLSDAFPAMADPFMRNAQAAPGQNANDPFVRGPMMATPMPMASPFAQAPQPPQQPPAQPRAIDFEAAPAAAPAPIPAPYTPYEGVPAAPMHLTAPPAPAPPTAPPVSPPRAPARPAADLTLDPPPAVARAAASPAAAPQPPPPPPAPTIESPRPSLAPSLGESFVDALNVLVSLLENNRTDLRGHSAHVARLTRKLCERMGLPDRDVDAIVAAAYLHDLGKASSYHLTSFNVSEYDGHKIAAKKSVLTPTRLMESTRLGELTANSIVHMYERFDGKGFPDELSGKDIPLGARIIAITDTYADLTQNPRNPFRKALRPHEAMEVLAKARGTIFDPNLVDLFKSVVSGDDLKKKLLSQRRSALVVDPDAEETTVLELRMIEQGFEVKIARNGEAALKLCSENEFELVISEVDLPTIDGFAFLEKARKTEGAKDAVFVFLSSRSDRESVNRGFELGAADYVQKPAKAEILVAKVKKLIETSAPAKKEATRGVTGSLEEMGLPDMVQILAQGRKTGALKIRSGNDAGEIHFVNGEVYNALFGALKGEQAVYAMIRLKKGEFTLDPNFKAEARVIHVSPEGLLLEGMRLMDEAGAPAARA